MSRLSPVPRSQSRASVARSDTTYHSFNDIELYEPVVRSPSPCRNILTDAFPAQAELEGAPLTAQGMQRKDSGYESITPRTSESYRRFPLVPPSANPVPRMRTARPSFRRAPKSAPVAHMPRNSGQFVSNHHQQQHGKPLFAPRNSMSAVEYDPRPFTPRASISSRHSYCPPRSSSYQSPSGSSTFFHFPNFASSDRDRIGSRDHDHGDTELVLSPSRLAPGQSASQLLDMATSPRSETPTHPTPPQTTHYWTSDRTRRLEYAAIDAASRGVRGWIMRHMVPDCFVPKNKRRVRFEDDRGSVVRYRLDLEAEEVTVAGENEKGGVMGSGLWSRKTKVWWFSTKQD